MPSMPPSSTATFRMTEKAIAADPPYGHSVTVYKETSATYPTPTALSLIYITDNDKDQFIARHMFMSKFNNLDQAELILFNIAKKGEPNEYWIGDDFIDMRWRQPCFVTVVLDIDNYEIYWNSKPGHAPIKFVKEREIDNGRPPPPEPYAPNYSFYNAQAKLIDNRSAVRCTNFLKGDEQGTDLKTEKDIRYYCIQINTLIRFASGVKHGHIIDPDGTNQGPNTI